MTRRGSEAWKRRVAEGKRRRARERRERSTVEPRDLRQLRASGEVPARLAGFLEGASVEAADLLESLGGSDRVSPQRRALVEDVARLGLVLRGELARYVHSGDPDAAARVGTLASARRASLVALGLDRAEREVPTLHEYLEERRRAGQAPPARAGDAQGGGEGPVAEPSGDRSAESDTAPRV